MALRIIKIFTLLFAVMVLAGCGQKGDLYLPGEKSTALLSRVVIG
jgi:predicted small lipoprotein YifL